MELSARILLRMSIYLEVKYSIKSPGTVTSASLGGAQWKYANERADCILALSLDQVSMVMDGDFIAFHVPRGIRR